MNNHKKNFVLLSFFISVAGFSILQPVGAKAASCPSVTKAGKFFNAVRSKVHRKISASQIESYNCIFKYWQDKKLNDKRWLAYAMGTAWHESRMRPIREGSGGHARAVRAAKFAWRKGWTKRRYDLPHPRTGKVYYGRGLVQITWAENYLKVGRKIGMGDRLYKNPELALRPDIATKLMFEGMRKGLYRVEKRKSIMRKCGGPVKKYVRAKLGLYFNSRCNESYRARNMINGDLKKTANRIKGYARHYRSGLSPMPVSVTDLPAGDTPPTEGGEPPASVPVVPESEVKLPEKPVEELENKGPVVKPVLPGEPPKEKLENIGPIVGEGGSVVVGPIDGDKPKTPSADKPETVELAAYKVLENKNTEQAGKITLLESRILEQETVLRENKAALANANNQLVSLKQEVGALHAELKKAQEEPALSAGDSFGQSGRNPASAGDTTGQSGQVAAKPDKPKGWFGKTFDRMKGYVWKN